MAGNKVLEISQETVGSLERRYWITAVGIVLAVGIFFYRDPDFFIIFTGLFIGGGIALVIGRLILAAITGEPKSPLLDRFFGAIVIGLPLTVFFLIWLEFETLVYFFPAVLIGAVLGPYLLKLFRLIPPNRFFPRWLGILIGGIIIFGIPIISLLFMIEKIPVLFVGLLGLLIFLCLIVYEQGRKEPEIYFYPYPAVLIILVTTITIGLPISAILYSSIIDSLAMSFLAGGVIGALLGIILVDSAQNAGQPGYVVAHMLGVSFSIFGIALGIPIGLIIDISINGLGFACC